MPARTGRLAAAPHRCLGGRRRRHPLVSSGRGDRLGPRRPLGRGRQHGVEVPLLPPPGGRGGAGPCSVRHLAARLPHQALAQDQLRALAEMRLRKLVPVTYDGDSGVDERTWARRNANVVLTNPEMLHSGILPHHARWATFLMRLQYVVVDELHVLRDLRLARGARAAAAAAAVRRVRVEPHLRVHLCHHRQPAAAGRGPVRARRVRRAGRRVAPWRAPGGPVEPTPSRAHPSRGR